MTPDTFPNFLDTRTPSAALWDKISPLTPLKRLLKQDNPDIMSINGIAISASCALHPSPKEHIYFLPDGGFVFRNRSYHLPAGTTTYSTYIIYIHINTYIHTDQENLLLFVQVSSTHSNPRMCWIESCEMRTCQLSFSATMKWNWVAEVG